MIKNRTAQLIFYTIYCTLGLVACIASLGIFDNVNQIRWDFYVHFTNISNYFCIAIMAIALVQTARKKTDSYVQAAPLFKFIGLLGILLTFLVFNIMLAGAEGRDPQLNWRIGSLLAHVVLPILYIADWFLFYERGKCKWYYPVASIGFPLAYVIFLLIQAIILGFDSSILIPTTTTPLIYPYFFVNLDTQGVPGVLMWIAILTVAFVAVGFAFFGIDKLIKKYSKAESESAGKGELIKKIFTSAKTVIAVAAIAILFLAFYVYMLARPISYGMEYYGENTYEDSVFKGSYVFNSDDTMIIENTNFDEPMEYRYYYKDGYYFNLIAQTEDEIAAEIADINNNFEEAVNTAFYATKINAFRSVSVGPDGTESVSVCNGAVAFTIFCGFLELALIGFAVLLFVLYKKNNAPAAPENEEACRVEN